MKECDLPELVRVHGESTNVLLWMDENDVELGRVQAEQGHVRAQADRHTQCRHLDLNTRKESAVIRIYMRSTGRTGSRTHSG